MKKAAKTNVFKKQAQDLTVGESIAVTAFISAIALAGTCGCMVAYEAVDNTLTERRTKKRLEAERIEKIERLERRVKELENE